MIDKAINTLPLPFLAAAAAKANRASSSILPATADPTLVFCFKVGREQEAKNA
jgi:hypothetical protein